MPRAIKDRRAFITNRKVDVVSQAELKLEADTKLARKQLQRRQRWQINGRLAAFSIVVVAITFAGSAISYYHHSTTAAMTFLSRARAAADEDDYSSQAKWLARYSLLRPDDLDSVVQAAQASDAAADNAEPEQAFAALRNARKQLSQSIARIADERPKEVADLRERLIRRLLQSGGPWLREAQRQVILLDAKPGAPEPTKSLALALVGQAKSAGYDDPQQAKLNEKDLGHWRWLASQKVGEVVAAGLDSNPDDLDLIANLLSLFPTRPEIFEAKHAKKHKRRISHALRILVANEDSRSKLILFQYLNATSKSEQANEQLFAAAKKAASRLSKKNQDKTEVEAKKSNTGQFPSHYWDFVLLQEAARQIGAKDRPQAARWYEQLMSLDLPGIPVTTSESVFASAGRLKHVSGDVDGAVAIWTRGLEKVDPNSLDLLGLIVAARSPMDSADKLDTRLDDFRGAIDLYARRLTRTSEGEMSSVARSAFARKIEVAKWRLNILDASQDAQNDRVPQAIRRLNQSLSSSVVVDRRERAAVAIQLASYYAAEGTWDQVAASYDRAVDLVPDDVGLRTRAADAWMRAGNRLRAMEHWRVLGTSNSLELQVASAEALFNYQLRLSTQQRDFSGVRLAINRIEDEFFKTDEVNSDRDKLQSARSQLAVLSASLPPTGVDAEDHLNSADFATTIHKLAQQHTEDETIQAFAAERLAEVGRDEESQQALARLETLVGETATPLAMVKARIEAGNGQFVIAAKRLLRQASVDSENVNPDQADQLRLAAANFATRGQDFDLAYGAVHEVYRRNKTQANLFSLAKLSRTLPESSKHLALDGKQRTPDGLSLYWEQELRDLEGDQGSYWKYLRAVRLIGELRNTPTKLNPDDPRLDEARTLVRSLVSSRPRWGEAISLEGWVAAVEGNAKAAVARLRRGIAAGDRRLLTRQCLFEQLCRLGRDAEAEKELHLASLSTDVPVDKYSTTRIQLAQRQGEYGRSLEVAEAAIKERPTDLICHVVMCKAATVAAKFTDDLAEKHHLVERARKAIADATKLSPDDEQSIYAARLELELSHGDESSVRREIEAIESSQLEKHARLILQSRGLLALKDFEAALSLIERADELKPSAETQLALAELYRRLHRQDDSIEALRLAQKRSPDNAAIRNNLARALAARDGEDVDWDELRQLLSSDGVTFSNRYLHAVLLALRGTDQQQVEALKMLRSLVRERNNNSDDAARFLAALLGKRCKDLDDSPDDPQRVTWLKEIRAIHESMVRRSSPEVSDLYRFADFLLDLAHEEDLPRVKTLLDDLRSMKRGTVAALEISVRYAHSTGEQESTPQIVQSWAGEAAVEGSLGDPTVATIAGASLIKLGFVEEGLRWHEQAYQEEPKRLPNYVVALSKVGRFQECTSVCAAHFESYQDVGSAVLLVESLMNSIKDAEDKKNQQVIEKALSRFDKDASLLESVATLRLQQQEHMDAVQLYKRVLKIEPFRVRTLNNLAMALSEIPGRAAEGIAPIDQAIKLAGEAPELLDTKGVVLLKAGKLVEAQRVFEKASLDTNEPRYQFHLIVALLEQKKEEEASRLWRSLEVEKLDRKGLTKNELKSLASLTKKYGS